jgi:CheY-like chemotaxis protein
MKPLKILFADDDLKYSMLLKRFLEKEGYEVTYAGNGLIALDQFPLVKPDLVLLDINMPGLNGFEVAKRIREADKHVLIFFLSDRSDKADRLQGFQLKANDYLAKPFYPEELTARIRIGKSPMTLFAGLGASAAVLMLVFKDSILGFVAGVQLSANDMLRIGDWIALPGGVANGVVEEITLNTVKIRNWDETISTVPPYTLVNNSFQNWRGMQESGGRRVNKNIFLDMTTLKFCTPEMLDNIRKEVPLMADYQPAEGEVPTNAQLYRIYIERYLCSLPVVNREMDLIVSQKEPTTYGVPILVYFFSRNKVWKEYERIQSDIFDHLLVMVQKFDLKLYQYSD